MTQWTAERWCNEGASLLRDDLPLARRMINQSIQKGPENSITWYNLGISLHQQRRIPAAIRAYRHALGLRDAPVSNILSNLSQDLLLNGSFEEGWHAYEHRLTDKKHDHSYFQSKLGEAWEGPEDRRPCNHMLLVAEQGFGDTLQFMRLALLLEEQGIKTSLFCQSALIQLLREQTAISEVIDHCYENNFTDKTLWCPLMSLPHRFKLTTERIPFAKGYLQNDRKRQNWWNKQLQRKKGHRLIALNWQGNPGHEKKIYSLDRSFAFQELLRFNRLEDTEFIAIQKGEGLEQLETDAGLEFVKGQEIFNKTMDFRDTAAVMANCDLVISSDSGVVHLAGAMGVACWVALRWIPEWRWGLEGEMTPWYDSVKLFRQKSQGDWASAIDHMLRVLQT